MNESIIIRPSLFTNSTGIFTVVGGDEWGNLEVAHFFINPCVLRKTAVVLDLLTTRLFSIIIIVVTVSTLL